MEKKKQLFKSLWHLGASGDWTSCLEPCFFFFSVAVSVFNPLPLYFICTAKLYPSLYQHFSFFWRELILKNTLQTSHSFYYCQCHMHTLITNYCIYKKKTYPADMVCKYVWMPPMLHSAPAQGGSIDSSGGHAAHSIELQR